MLAVAFLWGCAAPRQATKPEEPQPVSVHLPALEPMDIETRTQPPVVQPELFPQPPHPSNDVEEGKARSLKLMEIQFHPKKPAQPVESAPLPAPDAP